jgi:hypothetical protein
MCLQIHGKLIRQKASLLLWYILHLPRLRNATIQQDLTKQSKTKQQKQEPESQPIYIIITVRVLGRPKCIGPAIHKPSASILAAEGKEANAERSR